MPTKPGLDHQRDMGNGDQPTRTRVSRACDRCRSKKDKCDGARPTCSSCANSGHKCTYDPSTKKRGLPEGYVRGLEKLWALAIRKIEGLEDVMTTFITGASDSSGHMRGWGSLESPQSLRTDSQSREQGSEGEDILKGWNDERVEEFLHDTWKESPISRELEKLLSSIESGDDKVTKRKRERDESEDPPLRAVLSSPGKSQREYFVVKKAPVEYEKGHTARAFATQVVSEMAGFNQMESSLLYDTAPPPTKKLKGPQPILGAHKLPATDQSVKLPSNSSQLLDLYFSHTHCWLPIVERHDILRVSYNYSENPARPAPFEKGSGVHAVLWAIFAYSHIQFISSRKETSDVDSLSEQPSSPEDLYDIARSLIPLENGQAEIGHVQALILLTLVNVGQGRWTSSWLLIGHAVRLAIDLGLGENSVSSTGQTRSREKHVFLSCFMIDTLVSARLQRFPHLRREDAELAGPIDEDGLEEWDLWIDNTVNTTLVPSPSLMPARRGPTFALSTFNRAIELYGLLNDIIRDLSPDRESFCGRISQRLQVWHDKLPQVYRDSRESSTLGATQTLLPHQLYLYLGYFTTLTALHFHSHPFRKAFENPERRAPEIFAYLPPKISLLLKRQLEAARLAFMPPIYVYSVSLSIESATIGPEDFGAKSFSFTEWMQQTFQCVSELGKTWPVFIPLRQTLVNEWQMGNESFLLSLGGPDQTPSFDSTQFNRSNGRDSTHGDIWIPHQLPEQTSFETQLGSGGLKSRESRASLTDSLTTPRASQSGPILPPFSTPPESRNDDSPLDRMNQSSYNTELWAMQNVGATSNMLSSSLDNNAQSNPLALSTDNFDVDMSGLDRVPTDVTNISAISHTLDDINFMTDDVDAIFRDLAHLDTTEWTNHREEGLKDFGFADDSTFRAFCNDPERLVTGNAFFQTSPDADLWPPNIGPGDGSDRHLEASQILQSLSGNEQYPVLSEQRLGW